MQGNQNPYRWRPAGIAEAPQVDGMPKGANPEGWLDDPEDLLDNPESLLENPEDLLESPERCLDVL